MSLPFESIKLVTGVKSKDSSELMNAIEIPVNLFHVDKFCFVKFHFVRSLFRDTCHCANVVNIFFKYIFSYIYIIF